MLGLVVRELEVSEEGILTVKATWGLSCNCDLYHSSAVQILNPLIKARDRTCNFMFLVGFVNHCATTGTYSGFVLGFLGVFFVCLFLFLFFFVFLLFLGLLLWHMEIPRLGVDAALRLLACATALALPGLSCVGDSYLSSWQR